MSDPNWREYPMIFGHDVPLTHLGDKSAAEADGKPVQGHEVLPDND